MSVMQMSVAIVTKDGTEATARAARSAVADDLLVINNNCCRDHLTRIRAAVPSARFLDIAPARSIAHCWNLAILYARYDWVIISNDDVSFDERWVGTLNQARAENPNALHINLAYPKNRYGCFALHKSLVKWIGWFDERFPGTTHEDEDWHLRLSEHAGCDAAIEHEKNGRRDLVFAIAEAVLHKPAFLAADRARYGKPSDLSKAANERFFKAKWKVADKGWRTKGKVDGRYCRMWRALPEVNWYPGAIE